MQVLLSIPLIIAVIVLLYLFFASFFTVSTAEVAIITRFGKFLRIAEPGLNWKSPFFDSVSGTISLRVNQITLTMETKTKDNVFVTIPISVQNRVRPDRVYDAYYKLSNPSSQIQSYVEQVILGHVPGMTLDEVFASQSSIALAVKKELDVDMSEFGYEIVNVLVTDIVPDQKVKSAMNDINAAQREQVAANARGEAEKILVVKKAEAEAESKALQGQGIANQRKAIIEGLQASIEQFQKVVEGASAKEVMQLVMVTQYFDTLKSIGESGEIEHPVPGAFAIGGDGCERSDFAIDAGGERSAEGRRRAGTQSSITYASARLNPPACGFCIATPFIAIFALSVGAACADGNLHEPGSRRLLSLRHEGGRQCASAGVQQLVAKRFHARARQPVRVTLNLM